MLLPLLILASIAYVIYTFTAVARPGEGSEDQNSPYTRTARLALAGGIPIGVAFLMTYLFVIVGGATTVQFNAGSSSRMSAWSLWVNFWPLLLFLTASSGFGTLIWVAVCAFRKSMRPSLKESMAAFALSVLAFFTVATYFPTA